MALPLLIPAISALAGSLFGKLTSHQPSASDDISKLLQVPEIRALFELQNKQAQRADPLNQAIVTLAGRLLPRSAGFNDGGNTPGLIHSANLRPIGSGRGTPDEGDDRFAPRSY